MGLLDYGAGNLHSAAQALHNAGASVVLASEEAQLRACDRLVVPGVGAFAACMEGLRAIDGPGLITRWLERERPLLGICVGHQVLFDSGHEHGVRTSGLALLPGDVTRLGSARLPHMGWNTLSVAPGTRLLRGLENQRFYFVHSYAATHTSAELVSTATHETDTFVAAVEHGYLSATQFHPEKSGSAGARLLRNWLGFA